MKKTTLFLLVIVLILGLALPAHAADKPDSRLAKVTLAVKNTIDISDSYENFNGTLSEDPYSPFWYLSWYNDDGSEQLNITANEDGKIFSYSYYKNDYDNRYRYSPYFEPAFPSVEQEDAKKAAMKFLNKVLGDNESVELVNYEKSATETAYYNFYGILKVNDLLSPFDLSITVSTSDLKVTDFRRDDLYTSISGGYPPAKPAISAAQAKDALTGIYELEPLYVLTDDSKEARLVYLPKHSSGYVVNAITGELVEISGWARPLLRGAAPAEDAMKMDEASGAGLTEAELEGIALLEGVLKPDELEAAIRNISVLGIGSDFKFQDIRYYLDKETEEVSATVTFRTDTEDLSEYGFQSNRAGYDEYYSPYIHKYIKVNAKTVKLLSVNTYYGGIYRPYFEPTDSSQAGEIPSQVLDFIRSAHPREFEASALYTSSCLDNGVKQDEFTYCQKENGYFYTGNSIKVTVNTHTGKLDNYSFTWDNELKFEPAASVISEKDAIKIFSDTFEYRLSYTLKDIDKQGGYTQAYKILLVYAPHYDGYITGVSAITGELISRDYDNEQLSIDYDDIEDCNAKEQIMALAEYGIGFYSAAFNPDTGLTQKDMVLLLTSANGIKIKYNEITDEDLDWLYSVAENLGILKKSDRNPEKKVTRAEMVRTLVSMSGYGKAAGFRDIFVCGFKDDDRIADSDYGYIAMGKGLGIIDGGKDYSFRPYETVTRKEAAVMLYNFMSR
jgi:hypothetical protein